MISDERLYEVMEDALVEWLKSEDTLRQVYADWRTWEKNKLDRGMIDYPLKYIPMVANLKAEGDNRWRVAFARGDWHMRRAQTAALALQVRAAQSQGSGNADYASVQGGGSVVVAGQPGPKSSAGRPAPAASSSPPPPAADPCRAGDCFGSCGRTYWDGDGEYSDTAYWQRLTQHALNEWRVARRATVAAGHRRAGSGAAGGSRGPVDRTNPTGPPGVRASTAAPAASPRHSSGGTGSGSESGAQRGSDTDPRPDRGARR